MQTKHPEAEPAASFHEVLPEGLVEELEKTLSFLRAHLPREESEEDSVALIRIVRGMSEDALKNALPFLARQGWFALSLDKPAGQTVLALQRVLESLLFQRDHDFLTGLANRRLFDATLEREVQRGCRTRTELSLIALDIDDFKRVNDTHGHAVGDDVLKQLGHILGHSARPYDLAARIGGEEFCLILPGASAWKACSMGRRILELFSGEEFLAPGEARFTVTFSAGVATMLCHEGGLTPAELLRRADMALYQAKREGKNRVVAFSVDKDIHETACTLVLAEEKRFLVFGDNA